MKTAKSLTKSQRLKDEIVLAAIIAGGESSGRKVAPSVGQRPIRTNAGFGVRPNEDPAGPCCAVGAGVLYGGIAEAPNPRAAFANIHGVSVEYASGVSDGFENDGLYKFVLNDKGDAAHRDYDRGVAVGEAVWDYFYGSEGA